MKSFYQLCEAIEKNLGTLDPRDKYQLAAVADLTQDENDFEDFINFYAKPIKNILQNLIEACNQFRSLYTRYDAVNDAVVYISRDSEELYHDINTFNKSDFGDVSFFYYRLKQIFNNAKSLNFSLVRYREVNDSLIAIRDLVDQLKQYSKTLINKFSKVGFKHHGLDLDTRTNVNHVIPTNILKALRRIRTTVINNLDPTSPYNDLESTGILIQFTNDFQDLTLRDIQDLIKYPENYESQPKNVINLINQIKQELS